MPQQQQLNQLARSQAPRGPAYTQRGGINAFQPNVSDQISMLLRVLETHRTDAEYTPLVPALAPQKAPPVQAKPATDRPAPKPRSAPAAPRATPTADPRKAKLAARPKKLITHRVGGGWVAVQVKALRRPIKSRPRSPIPARRDVRICVSTPLS